jgi:general secretion pathway protein A
LSLEETGEYIGHRLKIAGTTEKIFTASAIREIYAYSDGFPRKINIICDHCLMSGYAEEKKTISPAMVKESAKDLQIPEKRRERRRKDEQAAPQPEAAAMAVSPPAGVQKARGSALDRTFKSPLFWSISGFMLLVLAVLAFTLVYLFQGKISYRGITDLGLSNQDRGGLTVQQSPGARMAPGPSPQTVVPATGNSAKASAPSVDPMSGQAAGSTPKKPLISAGSTGGTATVTAEPGKKVPAVAAGNGLDPPTPRVPTVQPVPPAASGLQVSSAATPRIAPAPLPEAPLVIRFQSDSNEFSGPDLAKMKEFARVVREHPEAVVTIAGYTDSIGDEEYNRKLSEFRANMVKSFLMGQNLSPEQLRAQGFGSRNPVYSNATAQGRIMNRRVEIRVSVNR